MSQEEIFKKFRETFAFSEIEWKVQVTSQDKARGMVVAYIDSRAIQNRLDEVVGAFNWKNAFSPWQNNSQICGLSIYDSERGEWVTKYDGADNTDIEPIKGGLSDSLDLLRNSVFPDFQGLENDFIQVKKPVNQVS